MADELKLPPGFTLTTEPKPPPGFTLVGQGGPAEKPEFQPIGETPFDKSMRGVARAVVPPVLNLLDYPFRALEASGYALTQSGVPTDEASRKKFYEAKGEALKSTEIPETPTGQKISQVLSVPGTIIGETAKGVSEATLGLKTTKAIAPFAGMATDVGALAGAGRALAMGPRPRPVRPEARDMIANGYVLPPAEIVSLGEHPSTTSKLLGAEAGKIKLQQEASTRNQINTNRLAAEGIGLHPDTVLTEQAIEQAKAPAKSVYAEVPQAVPEVSLAADGAFRSAVGDIGSKKGMVEKFFPEMKDHPAIVALRDDLLRNPVADTAAVQAKIADLRTQASTNFRAVGDAQKHALALAQREAAKLMEDQLEKSVTNAVSYNQSRLSAANREQNEATRALAQEEQSQRHVAGHSQSEQVAITRVRDAQERLQRANADVQRWRDALQRAGQRDPRNQTLTDRFRDARKLFAKIYTIEDATNRTTGNVSAAGLARTYNKGAPLTDELKTIADAYNSAPKSMQVPENFGRSEEWSALDFFGTAIAAASHHPGAIAGILGRPIARRTLLSRPYQRSEIADRPSPSPLIPLALDPGAAAMGLDQNKPMQ